MVCHYVEISISGAEKACVHTYTGNKVAGRCSQPETFVPDRNVVESPLRRQPRTAVD